MGGMDPDKICDPNKHPMKCETDVHQILQQLDEMDLTQTDVASAAIMHIAKVAADAPPKDRDQLRMMVAVVKKLLNRTSGALEPGVELDDLSTLQRMQEMVSGIFSADNSDLWREMEDEEDAGSLSAAARDWSLGKVGEARGTPLDTTRHSQNVVSRSVKGRVPGAAYLYFPDGQADVIRVPLALFGEDDEAISIQTTYYKEYHRVAPVRNSIMSSNGSGVFLASRVVSVGGTPLAAPDLLQTDPVIVRLEHRTQQKSAVGETEEKEPKVASRECVRWMDSLDGAGGGWSPSGCVRLNSTPAYTTCSCSALGTFALLALPPVPKAWVESPDEPWVWVCRGLGYTVSALLLVAYIAAVALRTSLHEQFHVIRLQLCVASLGALLAAFTADYKRHDKEWCRVLSGVQHYLHLCAGCWVAALAHALFRAVVKAEVEGRAALYALVAWGLPLVWVGVTVASSPNYGYEDRCFVGPSRGLRCSLACPLFLISCGSLSWGWVVCCNLTAAPIQRSEVVKELQSSTRMLVCVSACLCVVWVPGLAAWAAGAGPPWRKCFQVANAWSGAFLVLFLGLGSRHFRHAVLDKYVKHFNKLFRVLFKSNEIRPSYMDYTNGYRFEYKNYYR